MVLATVRSWTLLCRSMTGNCKALALLLDEPGYVQLNTEDAKQLGIKDQELVWIRSTRCKVITRAAVSDRPNKGAVYMTYQWWIGVCKRTSCRKLKSNNQNTWSIKY